MKNFRVTVNGNTYNVEVEELAPGQQVAAPSPVVSPPVVAPTSPAPKAESVSAPAAAPIVSGSASPVLAPMPGIVLDILVKAGDMVSKNQAVLILEAMKMENEIVTTVTGTVASVSVSKGDSVNAGDLLLSVAE